MTKFTTPKGTEITLTDLRGKAYMLVAHRLQWLNEECPNFDIVTDYIKVDAEESVVRAAVSIYDNTGKQIKKATATKRETKKDFGDHLEKAETAAIGRALSMLGYGTQYALSDLDEGDRLADSPLAPSKKEDKPKRASFRKPEVVATTVEPATEEIENATGWE